MVFFQHARGEDAEHYRRLIVAAKARNPELHGDLHLRGGRTLAAGSGKQRLMEFDPQLAAYYGSLPENLRRMFVYIDVRYLHAREWFSRANRGAPA